MQTWDKIKDLLDKVKYKDWRFNLELDGTTPLLIVEFDEVCIVTKQPSVQRSRKYRLSYHMTDGEIVQTAFLAVKVAIEHEMRESFTYKNEMIFGPHFDVEALVEICRENRTIHRGDH